VKNGHKPSCNHSERFCQGSDERCLLENVDGTLDKVRTSLCQMFVVRVPVWHWLCIRQMEEGYVSYDASRVGILDTFARTQLCAGMNQLFASVRELRKYAITLFAPLLLQ
jgi:hypothetical protein